MLDVTMLRKNLPEVVARLKTRNFDFPVDAFNELEERRKSVQKKTEELQARRNSLSKDIGMMKKNGEDASELLAQAAAIPGELKALEDELEEIREKLHDLMLRVPNLPSPTTPIGKDETENVEVRRWGTPRTFDFPVKDHVDVGAPLGLDFDTAAKLSGARFAFMRGEVAHLHRALAQFMLDVHTREQGYTECYTPYIVTASTMTGTGQLPKLRKTSSPRRRVVPTAISSKCIWFRPLKSRSRIRCPVRSSRLLICRSSSRPIRPASVPRPVLTVVIPAA